MFSQYSFKLSTILTKIKRNNNCGKTDSSNKGKQKRIVEFYKEKIERARKTGRNDCGESKIRTYTYRGYNGGKNK